MASKFRKSITADEVVDLYSAFCVEAKRLRSLDTPMATGKAEGLEAAAGDLYDRVLMTSHHNVRRTRIAKQLRKEHARAS